MNISKDHFIQEIDGISADDVIITQIEIIGSNIKICFLEWDDKNNCLLECEHIITNIDNVPSKQKDTIIITERKEESKN